VRRPAAAVAANLWRERQESEMRLAARQPDIVCRSPDST
jgi:hypothetical protein